MKSSLVFLFLFLGSSVLNTNLHSSTTFSSSLFLKSHSPILPVGPVYIVIDKSDYELHVYDNKGWYATYPVVFGNDPLADKQMEGDRKTPEGNFKIVGKKPHDKWDRFMALDYPTKDSYEKFKARKERGEIPASAKIGGGVGIHGVWVHEDYQIDRYKNWTLGCISMKNEDVEELYSYVTVGTKVTIRK